ncbi:MAG: hypothetical protein ACREOO_22100 [bacterium]
MNTKQTLLQRMQEIAKSLQANAQALALIGQGSVRPELDRLDDFSDLDLIILAKTGHKSEFLDRLDWLATTSPIAYSLKLTLEGYKILFADGVFCELAVFEPAELETPAFASSGWSSTGRVIWKAKNFEVPALLLENTGKATPQRTLEWMLGAALTNLYVGLLRYQRGEKLSAARFIQGYAVDRIIDLSELVEQEMAVAKDHYTIERRYEQRFPITSKRLSQFMQGYDRSVDSAREILKFLDGHFEVNPKIKAVILARVAQENEGQAER